MARALIDRDEEERRRKWWEQQPPTAIDPVGGEPMPTQPTAPRDALDLRTRPGVVTGRPTQGRPPTAAEQVLRDHALPQPVATDHLGRPLPTFTMARDARGVPLPAVRQRAGQGIMPRPYSPAWTRPEAQQETATQPTEEAIPTAPQGAGNMLFTESRGRGIVERPQQAAPTGDMTLAEMEQRGLSDLERQALGLPVATTGTGAGATLTPEDRSALNYSIDELAAIQKNPDQLQLPGGGIAFRDSDGKYRVAHGANEEVAKQYGLQAADERGVPERTTMRPVQGLTMRTVPGLPSGQASVGLMDRPDQWSPNRSPAPLILKTPQQERAEMEASRSEAMRRHAVPFIDRPSGQRAIDQAEADRTRSRRWGQSGSNTQWERRQRELQRREDDAAQIAAERGARKDIERLKAGVAQDKIDAEAAAAAAKSEQAATQFAETQKLKWAELKQQRENLTAKAVLNHIGDNMSFAQTYRELRDKNYDLNNKEERGEYNKALADINKKYFSNIGNTRSIELLGDSLMAPLDEYYRLTMGGKGDGVANPQETQGATPPPAKPKKDEGGDPAAKWRKTN